MTTDPDPRRRPRPRAGILRPDQLARHVQLERARSRRRWLPGWRTTGRCAGTCRAGTSYVSSTLPHPACNLSVERGHQREAVGDDPVVVTGVVTRRFDVTIRDEGWVYAAKFRPGGLAALTGVHARDAARRHRPGEPRSSTARPPTPSRELGPDAHRRRVPRALRRGARRDWPRPRPTTTDSSSTSSPRCSTTARCCGSRRSRSSAASAPARCSDSSSATSGSAPSGCSPATGCTTWSPTSTPGTAARWPTSPRSTAGSTRPTSPASSPTWSAYLPAATRTS